MINVNRTESFLKQQINCLEILTELIAFDKEHGNPPETARVLEAFIDTQRRALDMAGKLLEKHKPTLEAKEKAEAEKRQAEAQLNAAKAKEAQKKRSRQKKTLKKQKRMKAVCFVTSLMKMRSKKITYLKKQIPKLMTVTALKKMMTNEGAINEKIS